MYVSQKGFEQKNLYIYIWMLDKQVSEDEEDGRTMLNSPYTDHPANDESAIALLDSELPVKRARKKSACCMCFGLE